MANISNEVAYYSIKNIPSIDSKRKVIFHNCSTCTEGDNIQQHNFRKGIPRNAQYCHRCEWLIKNKKGKIGYPPRLAL